MPDDQTLTLPLRSQRLVPDDNSHVGWQVETRIERWPAQQTALVLCDVWDHHWCRGAERRLELLLPTMNRLVMDLRERGVQIVHAPSDTMAFYEGSPARKRVLAAPPVDPPPNAEHDDPPLPIDATGGGCDTPPDESHKAWSRQHPAIQVDEDRDAISDRGKELYAFYRQRGIGRVLLMGVHTNMCVLNRTFSIKQLVRWGIPVALVRDLTDAMATPARPPYVSHADGTQLVIEYIEKFWCPSVTSAEVVNSVPA